MSPAIHYSPITIHPGAGGRRSAIAFGSNLGDRLANLRTAKDRVLALPGATGPVLASAVFETAPVDCEPETPAYLNAVLEIFWNGEPSTLLEHLREIEREMGRPDWRPRNASRVIDLDILYCGEVVLSTPEITLPHPRLHLRRFVLEPLAGICPDRILAGQAHPVHELLAVLPPDASVQPIGETL